MHTANENEIISRVLAGDKSAYGNLIGLYKNAIFNLAYRITGNFQEAEDLAQETFVKAYSQLGKFDPEKPFFTWLYTISLNLIRNHLKKQKILTSLIGEPETADADPETAFIKMQENHTISNYILKLSPDLREAIVLRYIQDLKMEDAARVCGISLSAFKMRVYRALEKIKKWLEEDGVKIR